VQRLERTRFGLDPSDWLSFISKAYAHKTSSFRECTRTYDSPGRYADSVTRFAHPPDSADYNAGSALAPADNGKLKMPQGTSGKNAGVSRRQLLTVAAIAAIPWPVIASGNEKHTVTACPETGARDMEQFLDAFLPARMKQYEVPGAVFSLVKDGQVVFSKGYGLANIATKAPMDAKSTLVRAYSVSKAFTATAAMQLVEAGKLSLTENVNNYLELFKVPDTFPEPVTLAHLLTHTAGFVDSGNDTLLARGKLRTMSLGEWLKAYLPPRTRPVGAEIKYSNFGSSLAGYLIEVIAGQPFAEYMQQYVLNPLGMAHSSFLWPAELPAIDEARVAIGDARLDDGSPIRHMTPNEGDFANTPAANLLTTADEMAHFMIAHLNGGIYAGNRILSAAGIAAMHEPYRQPVSDWYKASNTKNDTGYGFFWRDIKDHKFRWLFHAGGWDGALSDMEMQPELKLGYFFWNNQGGDDHRKLRGELNMALAERLFSGCPS
jgi:CubicO group peptidase (beta-lactamase class C family)